MMNRNTEAKDALELSARRAANAGDATDADNPERERSHLFGIANRMLGSVSDADDIVQETFLRYHRALARGTMIASPRAYLSAVATRLAIDHLRSARVRRTGSGIPVMTPYKIPFY